MPQLPEDIIDRLTAMERRIQQLATAVTSRPAMNKVSGGGVEISDGGWLTVTGPGSTSPIFAVGAWEGNEYGVAIRRQTGQDALTVHNGDGSATGSQPVRIFDVAEREIISDDVNTGGLARPWLAMLPPQDLTLSHWPGTNVTTAFTPIARSMNVIWQPRMRLILATGASSGTVGQVQVFVDGAQWGSTVTSPAQFDFTGPVGASFGTKFLNVSTIEIRAKVTSGTGSVYAQPLLMYGTQS